MTGKYQMMTDVTLEPTHKPYHLPHVKTMSTHVKMGCVYPWRTGVMEGQTVKTRVMKLSVAE